MSNSSKTCPNCHATGHKLLTCPIKFGTGTQPHTEESGNHTDKDCWCQSKPHQSKPKEAKPADTPCSCDCHEANSLYHQRNNEHCWVCKSGYAHIKSEATALSDHQDSEIVNQILSLPKFAPGGDNPYTYIEVGDICSLFADKEHDMFCTCPPCLKEKAGIPDHIKATQALSSPTSPDRHEETMPDLSGNCDDCGADDGEQCDPECKNYPNLKPKVDQGQSVLDEILDQHAEYYVRKTMKFFQEHGESPALSKKNEGDLKAKQAIEQLISQRVLEELEDALSLWTAGETKQHLLKRISELKGGKDGE